MINDRKTYTGENMAKGLNIVGQQQVVEMHKQGLNAEVIASEMGVTSDYVEKLIAVKTGKKPAAPKAEEPEVAGEDKPKRKRATKKKAD